MAKVPKKQCQHYMHTRGASGRLVAAPEGDKVILSASSARAACRWGRRWNANPEMCCGRRGTSMAWWNGNPAPVSSVLPDPRGALPWMVTSLTCAITSEVALVGIYTLDQIMGVPIWGSRTAGLCWSRTAGLCWSRTAGLRWSSGGDRPTLSLPTQSMIRQVLIDHLTACSNGPVVSHLSKSQLWCVVIADIV